MALDAPTFVVRPDGLLAGCGNLFSFPDRARAISLAAAAAALALAAPSSAQVASGAPPESLSPGASSSSSAEAPSAEAPSSAAPSSGAPSSSLQPSADIRGINGSWERYPTRFSGLGSEPTNSPPPPDAIPEPPLKPEYLGEWRAREAEIKRLTEAGLPPANNYSACIPDGMPAMMQAMFPMEVLETPGQITVIEEAFNQVRRIYLNETLVAPEEAEPRFAGHSVGHWEGDTLVVETVGIKERVQFRHVPHSMSMRIVERLRLLDSDFLENRVTVTDPDYLTAPWSWTWMYRRWPGYKIQEYICEDNRYYADPEQGNQRLRIEPSP